MTRRGSSVWRYLDAVDAVDVDQECSMRTVFYSLSIFLRTSLLYDGCVLLQRWSYARWDAPTPFSDNLTNYFPMPLLGMVGLLACMDTCDLQKDISALLPLIGVEYSAKGSSLGC